MYKTMREKYARRWNLSEFSLLAELLISFRRMNIHDGKKYIIYIVDFNNCERRVDFIPQILDKQENKIYT